LLNNAEKEAKLESTASLQRNLW